jgi:hypothetical protein
MKKKIIITLGILTVLFTSIAGFAVASGVMDKKDKPSDYKIALLMKKLCQIRKNLSLQCFMLIGAVTV